MLYPYITLADETEILHSQIIDRNKQKEIEIHFERPTGTGFDTARCVLPTITWIKREGFTHNEILFFEELIKHHAHLIYRYAEQGGIKFAQSA
ncbi:MAG: hypothetical protein FWD90_09840 [Defluviitaleaceae bacterium]|nr:hypothetical protein [Defluviitaleaceae bacterium]